MNDAGGIFATTLPTFTPDPALWARVAGARRRQALRGRLARTSLAMAAMVVVGLAVAPATRLTQESAQGANVQEESRALEEEWRRIAVGELHSHGTVRVRAIDAALQTAYDRGAGTDETGLLWQQRNQALRDLIANAHGDASRDRGPIRI